MPAQPGSDLRIHSFHKKRTGFGPHLFDHLVPIYNPADEILNFMSSTLARSFLIPQSRQCAV
jgi:hypothetical protein